MKDRIRQLTLIVLLCALLTTLVPPVRAVSFQDVPNDFWAGTSIRRAVDEGLFRGETAEQFGVGHAMSRGAFAVVLCRLFQWDMVKPDRGSFTDNQNQNAWYYSAVETAFENGAVTGISRTYRPNDPVTREELAVMLVRGLGYTPIAGLWDENTLPFQDVTLNRSYLTMAVTLGIVKGLTTNTFAPDRAAKREEVAVMLMRVYRKIHTEANPRLGLMQTKADAQYAGELDAAAVAGISVGYDGLIDVTTAMSRTERNTIRTNLQTGGQTEALLWVKGRTAVLNGDIDAAANAVAQYVKDGKWDGMLLDFSAVTGTRRKDYTAFVRHLKEELGDSSLWITATAPCADKQIKDDYDFAALGQQADHIVLRFPVEETVRNSFVTAPAEPLEDIYRAMSRLKGVIASEKLVLQLTVSGSAWKDGTHSTTLSPAEVTKLLAAGDVRHYHSGRYASCYLLRQVGDTTLTVWYNDAACLQSKQQLAAFFGNSGVCFDRLGGVVVSPAV